MSRILLLNPPSLDGAGYTREGRCMQREDFWSITWPPLTLAICAAMARDDGHDVQLVDGAVGEWSRERLASIVREFLPEVAVLTTGTPSIMGDLAAAQLIHEVHPETKIVLLGIHAAETDARILHEYPCVTAIVRGEPEWTLQELLAAWQSGNSIEGIAGIAYRDNDVFQRNEDRAWREDLSALPYPAWDLLDLDAYTLPDNGERLLLVSTVRGCPYPCTFCHTAKYYGKKVRTRPVEALVAEMEHGRDVHGVRHYLMWSELFTADRQFVFDFCALLKRRMPDAVWHCSSRVDAVDEELLRAMADAGCRMIAFGFESSDKGILDHARKKMDLADAPKAVVAAHRAGLEVAGHFILGLPGETETTARRTVEWAIRLGVDYAQFYCAAPFPGTQLYEEARQNGWLVSENYADMQQTRAGIKTSTLSAERLEELRAWAYRKFYMRPSVIWRGLRSVRSAGQARRLLRVARNLA